MKVSAEPDFVAHICDTVQRQFYPRDFTGLHRGDSRATYEFGAAFNAPLVSTGGNVDGHRATADKVISPKRKAFGLDRFAVLVRKVNSARGGGLVISLNQETNRARVFSIRDAWLDAGCETEQLTNPDTKRRKTKHKTLNAILVRIIGIARWLSRVVWAGFIVRAFVAKGKPHSLMTMQFQESLTGPVSESTASQMIDQ